MECEIVANWVENVDLAALQKSVRSYQFRHPLCYIFVNAHPIVHWESINQQFEQNKQAINFHVA